jgi:Na+/H+ antiporter NhaD/arsenite permease-like protein
LLLFLLSLFIWIELLDSSGWITTFSFYFSFLLKPPFDPLSTTLLVSLLSSFACVVMNNQPMTVFFTRILLHEHCRLAPNIHYAQYALIQGSNYGANLGKVGALAGIMWFDLITDKWPKKGNTKPISTLEFSWVGWIVTIPTIACSSIVLFLTLQWLNL